MYRVNLDSSPILRMDLEDLIFEWNGHNPRLFIAIDGVIEASIRDVPFPVVHGGNSGEFAAVENFFHCFNVVGNRFYSLEKVLGLKK